MTQARILLYLCFLVLLSACSSTQMIASGAYQTSSSSQIDGEIEFIQVDARNHTVTVQLYGNSLQEFSARPLPKDEWREDCHTNMSREVLETWQLSTKSAALKSVGLQTYLFAGCGGDGLIMESQTATLYFTIVKTPE